MIEIMHVNNQIVPGTQLRELPRFSQINEMADLFVILVSYNTAGLLHRCINCLRVASQGLRVSVVIVDNASRDGSVALLKRDFSDCNVIENSVNVGFGRANNHALTLCNAPLVLLLNTDAFMSEDTLQKTLGHMATQTRCGILGARLVNEEGEGNASARDFPTAWQSFALQTGLNRRRPTDRERARGANAVDCDWITGCFYLVRHKVIDEVGLFDPRYFMYFEEVDHCRAAQQAGWKVQCLLSATVIHVGGASARSEGELTKNGNQLPSVQIESELLYFRKHGGIRGFALTLILGSATDAVLSIKDLLRGRGLQRLSGHARHTRDLWRLAVATGGGLHPTH